MSRFVSAKNLAICLSGWLVACGLYYAPPEDWMASWHAHKLFPVLVATRSLDVQERCAKQAAIAFTKANYHSKATYVNHYNPRLGMCFIRVEDKHQDTAGLLFRDEYVVNAYEGAEVAHLIITQADNKDTAWACEVKDRKGESRICKSEAEFDSLIKYFLVP